MIDKIIEKIEDFYYENEEKIDKVLIILLWVLVVPPLLFSLYGIGLTIYSIVSGQSLPTFYLNIINILVSRYSWLLMLYVFTIYFITKRIYSKKFG